jgi:hypothetical protein
MKRTITLLIATALMFGMSQCKKNVETITPSNLGEAVHITVNVDDGGKHIVYPGTGAYVFENGDKLYVGNDGHYIGTLEYNSGAFSGDIYNPSTEDYLHFYFVGGLTPSATLVAGTTTDFTVNIANQSSKLPVLSYAHSTQKYVDGTTTYGCTLLNKCGLVKFVPATPTTETVMIGGMKTTAIIDFTTPGITPTEATGNVILYSESNAAKWAILLPQEEVNSPSVTIVGYNSTINNVPAIIENYYNKDGVSINMTKVNPYIDAVFTVGSSTIGSGTTVKFSKGNLQYLGTGTSGTMTPKWRFADNQWDYMLENNHGNVIIEGYSAYNTGSKYTVGNETTADKQAARDLFGWGSSGGGTTTTYPYSTMNGSGWESYYGGTSDIAGTDYDWGVFNRTTIENNDGKSWRTLTSTEWNNLFNRTKNNGGSEKLYGFATVMGVKGIVVLPDNWNGSVDNSFTYAGTNYTANQYTATSDVTWGMMEAAGAVFLPAASLRNGDYLVDVGSAGGYWSSSIYSDGKAATDDACYVYFYSGVFNATSKSNRAIGCSVRLVFTVEQ